MQTLILNTGVKKVIFRLTIENTDNIYIHEVNENCKFPAGFQNDFVVENYMKVVNQEIININPDTPPVYELEPVFDIYFDGIELNVENPLFIQAVQIYMENVQDWVFA